MSICLSYFRQSVLLSVCLSSLLSADMCVHQFRNLSPFQSANMSVCLPAARSLSISTSLWQLVLFLHTSAVDNTTSYWSLLSHVLLLISSYTVKYHVILSYDDFFSHLRYIPSTITRTILSSATHVLSSPTILSEIFNRHIRGKHLRYTFAQKTES